MSFNKLLGEKRTSVLPAEQELSILDGLITQNHITKISFHYLLGLFDGCDYFSANIKFKKENTELEQEFTGKNLVDVFHKARIFCENLPE